MQASVDAIVNTRKKVETRRTYERSDLRALSPSPQTEIQLPLSTYLSHSPHLGCISCDRGREATGSAAGLRTHTHATTIPGHIQCAFPKNVVSCLTDHYPCPVIRAFTIGTQGVGLRTAVCSGACPNSRGISLNVNGQ